MSDEIRILSLWQPWASLIAMGLKKFETRSWGTPYRGKLAIHAAKRPVDSDGFLVVRKAFELAGKDFQNDQDWVESLQFGCIVAIANLTHCRQMISEKTTLTEFCKQPESVQETQIPIISLVGATELERTVGDWQPGRYAWKLGNICPIAEPIPFKGGQGLRIIRDSQVLEQIAQQIAREVA